MVGFGVAIVAYVLRVISDSTCGGFSDICEWVWGDACPVVVSV